MREPYVTSLLRQLAALKDPKSNETIARLNELSELIKYPQIFRPCHPIYTASRTTMYNKHINCCEFNSLLSAYLIRHKASVIGRIVSIEEGSFHIMELTEIDLMPDKSDPLIHVMHI
jgi:hypothetical protein